MAKRKEKSVLLAITMGDPAGIGPEVILKAFKDKEVFEGALPVVVGSVAVMQYYAKELGIDVPVKKICALSEVSDTPGTINVIEPEAIPPLELPFIRNVNKECGQASYEFLIKAITMVLAGEIDAIATASLCKESLNLAGIPFPGHTEALAAQAGTKDYAMMMQGGGLRVVLATIHIPLWKVSNTLTKINFGKMIDLTHSFMRYFGIGEPRIGICGVNPHASESGMFGEEENTILVPAVRDARERKLNVSDPQPADTIFHNHLEGKYDVIIAMYHDQALIPIKTLDFYHGVNITLGLPFIRTSVDHGTAFDIAGKGIAHPGSMKEAIKTAILLAQNKKQIDRRKSR